MLDCGLDPEKFEHAYEKGIVLGKKKAHKVKNFKISIIKLLFYRFKGSFSRKDLSLEEFTQEFSDILESILDELEKVVDSWEEETVNLEVPTFPKFERKNKKLDPVQKENKDNIQELNETKPVGQGESDSSYEEKVPLIKTVTVKIHGLKWKINFYKGEILFKIDFKYSNLSMIASDVADEEKNDFQRYRGLIVTSKKGIRIPEDLKNHQEWEYPIDDFEKTPRKLEIRLSKPDSRPEKMYLFNKYEMMVHNEAEESSFMEYKRFIMGSPFCKETLVSSI